jgi:ATP-dependent helicase/nuclease subunit B
VKKFLTKVAEKIIADELTGSHSAIVLPNRRSIIFLKDEIKKLNRNNLWLPEFIPFDEFTHKISGFTKADKITLSIDLYNVHRKLEGKKASSIDDFLTWAPIIISDFNDIDNSLASAKDIYHQLSAIKAIQQWNPDGRPLTRLQKNYIHFFNSMYDYYIELNELLKEKGIGYHGMICRSLAENNSVIDENIRWNNILFVGVNALSEAELQIVGYLNKTYKTNFIWDIDDYYYPNGAKKVFQKEAGKNIHNIINRLKVLETVEIESNLTESRKNIRILGVPKNIGQTKFIGQELQNIDKNKDISPEVKNGSTAIILANEGLLIQLLHSLPKLADNEDLLPYNLTLGYPLKNSQFEDFFTSWIDLLISFNELNSRIATNELIHFLNIPVVKQLVDQKGIIVEDIIRYIIKNNLLYITTNEIVKLIPGKDIHAQNIITKLILNNNTQDSTQALESLKEVLIENTKDNSNTNIIFCEQLQSTIGIISRLCLLARNNTDLVTFSFIKKIGVQLINQSRISLLGEPLTGIQIMGMLETRALDFDNIYILSVNEGILPADSNFDSLIPFDIKKEHNLTLPTHYSEIYSYHFYRLLQRSKNITLIFNSDNDNFGGGEKSRFILQIENELQKANPNINLTQQVISSQTSKYVTSEKSDHDIIIPKSRDILSRIKLISQKGFSASLLNTYISCSLKFYFSYLLKIDTKIEVKQSVEPNIFGTVLHEALEDIYKPFEGKKINVDILKKALKSTRIILSEKFKIHYNNDPLNKGKNMLIFEVANSYLQNFLKWDIKNINIKPKILLNTESKLVNDLIINGENVRFKGIIDRIDKEITEDTIRVIDYKTGKVDRNDLIIKNTDDLFSNPKYAKAFQVTYYAWLVFKYFSMHKMESGIISIRNISNGFIPLSIKEHPDIQDYFKDFEDSLLQITSEIQNKEIPFRQTQDANLCMWCDYKSVCNR